MQWIRRNLKFVLPAAVVGIGVVAFLAFSVFGVHTLFIDDKVDEAGPVFSSGATADAAPTDTATPGSAEVDASGASGEDQATSEPAATDAVDAAAGEADVDGAGDPVPTEPATTVPPSTAPAEPQIVTLVEGSFIPRGRYSGEGQASVLNDGSEQRFLRFESFSTDNGPDLKVYLVNSDANADEGTFDDDFIDLGALKGNIGDQNYEIAPEVDLAVYDTVVVWCVRFSSAFTAADLVAA